MIDGSDWVIGGTQAAMITNYIRKPHIYKGNPEFEGSFGTNPEIQNGHGPIRHTGRPVMWAGHGNSEYWQ
jgi:hypothetical protein